MKKEVILLIVLVTLVIVSTVQAFQLSDLRENVEEGNTAGASPTKTSSGGGSTSSNPGYGGMVGGC